jgi:hypothetical protein
MRGHNLLELSLDKPPGWPAAGAALAATSAALGRA